MTQRVRRGQRRGGWVGYSLISWLELVVISIIIFSRRKSLQLKLGAVWKGRAWCPRSKPTGLPLWQPCAGLYSYGDAGRYVNASVSILRFCLEERRRYVKASVLRTIVEKIDPVVQVASSRCSGHCSRPPRVSYDFCPNYLPNLKHDFFFLRLSAVLHLNAANNIFILYEPLLQTPPYPPRPDLSHSRYE